MQSISISICIALYVLFIASFELWTVLFIRCMYYFYYCMKFCGIVWFCTVLQGIALHLFALHLLFIASLKRCIFGALAHFGENPKPDEPAECFVAVEQFSPPPPGNESTGCLESFHQIPRGL